MLQRRHSDVIRRGWRIGSSTSMRKLGLLLACMLISAGAAHAPPPPPPNSSSREAAYKPGNDSLYPDVRHSQHQGPSLYPSSCTPPSATATTSGGAAPSAGVSLVKSPPLWSPSCSAMMRGRMQIMRGRILRLTTTQSDKWGNALSPYWMARSMAGGEGRGAQLFVFVSVGPPLQMSTWCPAGFFPRFNIEAFLIPSLFPPFPSSPLTCCCSLGRG